MSQNNENKLGRRFVSLTSSQSVSGLHPEFDRGGNRYLPRFIAKMVLSVPAEMSPLDIKAVWHRFTEDLRNTIGYNDEIEAYKSEFEGLLYEPKEGE